jgi:hypothetical protein
MADTKISALSAAGSATSTMEIPVNNAGTSNKVTLAQVKTLPFPAGSASANSWPKLTSGTVLTTPEAGALEYDGNAFYATTEASNRGLWPAVQIIRANATRTFTSNTSQQPIFNSPANGSLTLGVGTYLFECLVSMDTMSATSGNGKFSLNSGGTATLGSILYMTSGMDAALDTLTALSGVSETTATQAATNIATAATATVLTFFVKGTFQVTVSGTIIPSFAQTTANAAVVKVGSYFMCQRVGSTSLVSVGNWS